MHSGADGMAEPPGHREELTADQLRFLLFESTTGGHLTWRERAIMENAMLDIMYDVPYREGIKECRITEGVILRAEEPLLSFEKEKKSA